MAAFVGDTLPSDGVDALAANADAYVQTVIRRDLVELVPNEMMQDILDYHSGVIEAAQTAARVGAKRLVLTHMGSGSDARSVPGVDRLRRQTLQR